MRNFPLIRIVAQQLRRFWWALPPFPRLPSPVVAVRKLRHHFRDFSIRDVVRLPDQGDVAEARSRWRYYSHLPPLPVLSFKKAWKWARSRRWQSAVNPALLVDSTKEMVSAIRREKRTRHIAIAWAILIVAGIGLYLVWAPAAVRIKGWQARRAAGQAEILMDRDDWTQGAERVRTAFNLAPTEPATWHAVARLLGQSGDNSEALRWWQKFAEVCPLTTSDRRSYAAVAVSANELALATDQMDQLLAEKPVPASDLRLAAQLASLQGNSAAALDYAQRALRANHPASLEVLRSAVLVFVNTTPTSTPYSDALHHVVDLARHDSGPAGLQALRMMAAPSHKARMTNPGPGEPQIIFSSSGPDFMSTDEIADKIENHPMAVVDDRLCAAGLRAQNDPTGAERHLNETIEECRHGDNKRLVALADWLYEHGRVETMLQILPLDRVVQDRQLFLERIDALSAAGQFSDLAEMLSVENPILDPMLGHVFLALAKAKLGEEATGANEWERAVETADTTQRCLLLAQYAEKSGLSQIADDAYDKVLKRQPRLRSAYVARLRLAEAMGETEKAYQMAEMLVELWPEDTNSRMLEIYLRLLLGSSAADTKIAEETAGVVLQRNPESVGARMVLALARLKSGRQLAALEAVPNSLPGHSSAAPPLAVRAAALDANGWHTEAREEARKLAAADLLPEERNMVAALIGPQ